ncbi:MAG: hypothetical protein WAM04_09980 [Candidatus Sulfotelmatobacter sp.]
MGHTTPDLEHRLRLVQKIVADLKFIDTEIARLGGLAEKVAGIATALRLLREMERERNPPTPKEAA